MQLQMRMLRITTGTSSALLLAVLSAALAGADERGIGKELLTEASGLLERDSPQPGRAADLWADIGFAQAKLGMPDSASASFVRAWKATAGVKDDFDRSNALTYTVEQQIRAGQLRQAVTQARAISSHGDQWRVLLSIASTQEINKDFAGARQTIDAIPATDPESQARKLSFLAEAYAAQQDFPAALSACDRIVADWPRALQLLDKTGSGANLSAADRSLVSCAGSKRVALMMVVYAMNRAGQFDAAIHLAARMEPALREQAFFAIAKAAADAGQIALAQKCVSEVADPHRRDDAASPIVAAQAKAGRFKEALDLISRIQDRTIKAGALFRIIQVYAARGDEPSVRKEYERVMALERGTWGLVDDGQKEIVAGFLRGGHIEQAVSFADRLEREEASSTSSISAKESKANVIARAIVSQAHWETIADVFQGIGIAAAKAGKRQLAQQMFEKSRSITERIKSPSRKVSRFHELALAQADAGDRPAALTTLESAFQAAQKMTDRDSTDVDTLVELATTQAAMNQRESARTTLALAVTRLCGRPSQDAVAGQLPDMVRFFQAESSQPKGGDAAAGVLQKAGRLQNLVRSFQVASSQAEARDTVAGRLHTVLRAQAWFVDVDEALQVARKEKAAVARASMLVGIVQGLLARREGKPVLKKTDPLQRSYF